MTDTTKTSGSLLGEGSEFSGKLTFLGTVRIEGRFDGEVLSKDTLVVAEGGKVTGKIEVDTLIVTGGKVDAEVIATTSVEVSPPGVLSGIITTPCLQIEKGAIFKGQSVMPEQE